MLYPDSVHRGNKHTTENYVHVMRISSHANKTLQIVYTECCTAAIALCNSRHSLNINAQYCATRILKLYDTTQSNAVGRDADRSYQHEFIKEKTRCTLHNVMQETTCFLTLPQYDATAHAPCLTSHHTHTHTHTHTSWLHARLMPTHVHARRWLVVHGCSRGHWMRTCKFGGGRRVLRLHSGY